MTKLRDQSPSSKGGSSSVERTNEPSSAGRREAERATDRALPAASVSSPVPAVAMGSIPVGEQDARELLAAVLAKARPFDEATGTWGAPLGAETARAEVNARKPRRAPKPSSAAEREAYRRELALGAEERTDAAASQLAATAPSRSFSSPKPRQRSALREPLPMRGGKSGSASPRGSAPRKERAPRMSLRTERRIRFEALLAREGAPDCSPRDLPDRAYALGRTLVRGTSRQVVKSLAELPAVYAHRVRRAARGVAREAGREGGWSEAARELGDIRARLVVAAGVVLYHLGQPTRRRGYARVVDGYTREMLAQLFHDPRTNEPYSVSYLFGTKFRPDSEWWDCGPFVALAHTKTILKVQPPADEVPKRYVGPSGHAFNEYWLSALACSADVPEDERDGDAGQGAAAPEQPTPGPAPPVPI
jgi:hypothetical protein